mmetsp:Transcript_35777/g.45525  ORF Transcript_35777/g.45525 Transcript_35777/m.45525 type:complete len:345 (-) Transcript_35777:379-1413(-)
MKFQKKLEDAIKSADPEWDACWINYKMLKKRVKDLIGSSQTIPEEALRIKESEFTKLVLHELRKCSRFFLSLNGQLDQRKTWIQQCLEQYQGSQSNESMQPRMRLMQSCLNFYRDLLLIENYAIMTYCGFSKILKKHDKRSKFKIRDQFMTKFVQTQEFARYTTVITMLAEIEQIFVAIKSEDVQQRDQDQELQGEQKLFIDTLRKMNEEALKIHEEESQPSGDNTENENVGLDDFLEPELEDNDSSGILITEGAEDHNKNSVTPTPTPTLGLKRNAEDIRKDSNEKTVSTKEKDREDEALREEKKLKQLHNGQLEGTSESQGKSIGNPKVDDLDIKTNEEQKP